MRRHVVPSAGANHTRPLVETNAEMPPYTTYFDDTCTIISVTVKIPSPSL